MLGLCYTLSLALSVYIQLVGVVVCVVDVPCQRVPCAVGQCGTCTSSGMQ